MENSNQSLLDLFTLRSFRIPQYQRAYAWEVDHSNNKQVTTFLEDLRQQVAAQKENPDKNYFLGTLLLHKNGEFADVVDGQQRLTTTVIFIAAAVAKSKEAQIFADGDLQQLSHSFLFDAFKDKQKFSTIAEDNPFFRHYILKLEDTKLEDSSPSAQRLKAAMDYFLTEVKDEEWSSLVASLLKTNVMVYSVTNSADATLIFELQNDRGKKLTALESLKSYLMHLIYLNTTNPDEGLMTIQTHFSGIYRHIERQAAGHRIPKEDAILAYHCAAYLDWADDEWRRPKDLIKDKILSVPKKGLRKWVLEFVAQLHQTYAAFTDLSNKLDIYVEFSQLFVLDRMATFWPAIIKAYKLDSSENKKDFLLACRLMEVYALRGYGLGNVRSDTGLSAIYREARIFNGDFAKLHQFLHGMCSYRDIEERFFAGIDKPSLYKHHKREALYILWRYENHLRSLQGYGSPKISWRNYLLPADNASKLNIEHVAAQSNPMSQIEVEWEPGAPKLFSDVCLHRLGNLVLDSTSSNASKGKHDFSDKIESLEGSTYLSHKELKKWAISKDSELEWNIEAIKRRHDNLKAYVLKHWDPNSYFVPTVVLNIEDEIGEIEDVTVLEDAIVDNA